ncbi:MAG: DUF2092 domain-containing protein [Caulobacter sp.]|nr:DUF2092 domain-containing protein [Caulobacter sp.]
MSLALGLATSALGQAASSPPSPKPDADAIAALNKMGEALRALTAFTVSADVTTEDVLDNGQKLQYAGDLKIEARRPSGFKIYMNAEHQERVLYYDGKSVTVFAPKIGYYASVAAPPTIAATLDVTRDKYGIEFPLADLFSLGTDPTLIARIKDGFNVGPDTVGGLSCQHYAFRQEAVDWQVWIRTDGPALPCKMVITTTDDPAQPQYTAVMRWEADKAPPQADYTFKPPADAHRITVAEVSAASVK